MSTYFTPNGQTKSLKITQGRAYLAFQSEALCVTFDYNRLDFSLLSVWRIRSCHRQEGIGKKPYRA
jgi:hypothetical protein